MVYACTCTQHAQVIGQFAPAFAGYQQQDSQELMLFLLDGLHEDLNRVRKRPYVETVESMGRPDDVVAEESWRRNLLRDDSVFVDRGHGLLRSHVTCPTCRCAFKIKYHVPLLAVLLTFTSRCVTRCQHLCFAMLFSSEMCSC